MSVSDVCLFCVCLSIKAHPRLAGVPLSWRASPTKVAPAAGRCGVYNICACEWCERVFACICCVYDTSIPTRPLGTHLSVDEPRRHPSPA